MDGKTKSAGNVAKDGEMKKSEMLPTRTEKLLTRTERRKVQEMLWFVKDGEMKKSEKLPTRTEKLLTGRKDEKCRKCCERWRNEEI
jgi:hypothetical protein